PHGNADEGGVHPCTGRIHLRRLWHAEGGGKERGSRCFRAVTAHCGGHIGEHLTASECGTIEVEEKHMLGEEKLQAHRSDGTAPLAPFPLTMRRVGMIVGFLVLVAVVRLASMSVPEVPLGSWYLP